MSAPLTLLKQRLARVTDLKHAAALLEWDQETYMPEEGANARARQTATLRSLAHEILTDDETGTLLQKASRDLDVPSDEPDGPVEWSDEAIDADLVRVSRRDFDKATRVPSSLVAALAQASGRAKGAWQKARATNDFFLFQPHLEHILDLTIQHAEALGFDESPYDALVDQYEEGMTASELTRVFRDLRQQLVPIVRDIAAAAPLDDRAVHGHFPDEAQWAFGMETARAFGYDLGRGRQDISTHPFSTAFSIDDVRITTRFEDDFFNPAFFGTLHEVGHALYEQGVDPGLEGLPLADGTSLGMHESQSRMWENQIGRSRVFWERTLPSARIHFPEAFARTTVEDMYRAVNRVAPSAVRVEADEVTYNLHIMLRFELEQELVSGKLAVRELPEAWNDRMEAYLGIRPESDADGVLQDIHWSLGAIGYFPTYALGNLMSAQLFDAATTSQEGLPDSLENGDYAPLLTWLREHIHRPGRRRTARFLLKAATGQDLSADSWIRYVKSKFGELYGI